MAHPLTNNFTLFDAIGATTTTEFHTVSNVHGVQYAGSYILEVVGDGSANYALDFQGKATVDGTYTNLWYEEIWTDTPGGRSNNQLTVNDTTRRFYQFNSPVPPFVQAIATRTAGALTIHVHLSSSVVPPSVNMVEGPGAEDGAVVGNPLLSGGRYDSTARTLDNGDVGAIALDVSSRVIVASPVVHGASEVKTVRAVVNDTAAAVSAAEPTAGKKIRIVSVNLNYEDGTIKFAEVFFHDDVTETPNITTDGTKAICHAGLESDATPNFHQEWPDGTGPIGAVDDHIVVRQASAVAASMIFIIHYREE